jgi:hypothetical protein
MIKLQVDEVDVVLEYEGDDGQEVLGELVFGIDKFIGDVSYGNESTKKIVYDIVIDTLIALRDGKI